MASRQLKSHRPALENRVQPLPPEEGPPSVEPVRPKRIPFLVFTLVAGIAGGIWIGASWSGDRTNTEAFTNLGAAAQSDGIAVAITGFADTLLAVGTNGSEPMELATWPPSGRLEMRALPAAWTAISFNGEPFADFAEFDASGKQIALAVPVAREQSVGLLAGRPEEPVPVATGVTSYVWHVETPRSLAYVVEEGEAWIEVMSGAPRSVERIRTVDSGSELAAWGAWGFLRSHGSELMLLDSAQGRFLGRFLAASTDAILIQRSDELGVAEPDGSGFASLGAAGNVSSAAFDSLGERLAIGRSDGLTILSSTGERLFAVERPFIEDVAWSRDGAFVVFADRIDVHILELATGTVVTTGLGPAVDVATRSTAVGSG